MAFIPPVPLLSVPCWTIINRVNIGKMSQPPSFSLISPPHDRLLFNQVEQERRRLSESWSRFSSGYTRMMQQQQLEGRSGSWCRDLVYHDEMAIFFLTRQQLNKNICFVKKERISHAKPISLPSPIVANTASVSTSSCSLTEDTVSSYWTWPVTNSYCLWSMASVTRPTTEWDDTKLSFEPNKRKKVKEDSPTISRKKKRKEKNSTETKRKTRNFQKSWSD